MYEVKELAKSNTTYIMTLWSCELACEVTFTEEAALSSR